MKKTSTKYCWLCTYTTAAGTKTVVIGHAKSKNPLLFSSPGDAAIFLNKAGFTDYILLGKCKCVLQEVEV